MYLMPILNSASLHVGMKTKPNIFLPSEIYWANQKHVRDCAHLPVYSGVGQRKRAVQNDQVHILSVILSVISAMLSLVG
jgi:hypothetical protein